ncbi:hypothetical protein H2198_006876 [Neophaeococcomyces mojaviensis]|uniref:Uncharacterized protein n=1 Tax=Neophaeococcomyces mojaviensis TaxID=3383035 RepID=A0ACC3A1U8_9EURO|nr:hypothetical protein H2198_006876 [Knufia sp. JES_112]
MTFTDLSQHRDEAILRPQANPLKLPRFGYLNPPARLHRAQSSLSATTTINAKIRRRLHRGVSSVRSFFKSRAGRSDTDGSDNNTQALLISHKGSHAGFSATTTVTKNPLRLHLTAMPSANLGANYSTNSVPLLTDFQSAPQNSQVSNRSSLRRKLSTKLLSTFNSSPTVVVKPELRARPSVQTISNARSSTTSSAPSTPSSTSTMQHNGSTPPTSDGTNTGSSGSVLRHELDLSAINNQHLVFFEQNNTQRKLSTIQEIDGNQIATIKTIEATAAAKIFFETHFNALLHQESPRLNRRKELEERLTKMQLPPYLNHRIRRNWTKNESEALRRNRLLCQSGRQAVKIGAYQIVKVLGKGSFGVVRLVRDTDSQPSQSAYMTTPFPITPSTSRKSSMATLTKGLMHPKKQVLPPNKQIYAMKVIRKADMLRNAQEGHLRAERNFLVAAESSKWVVPLITAFQDVQHLYLVMNFCIGGDFLGLLIRKNTLSEQITK